MKPVIKAGTWSLIATAVRRRWLMVLVAVVVTPVVAVSSPFHSAKSKSP